MCHDWCEFADLRIEEVPPPPMRPGGVRIAVAFASISFATSLVVAGKYQRKPPRPFAPGTEVAGFVTEVAPDATRFRPGDRVVAILDWGGHAEEAVATEATT
jgi:NADPH2:quinone reductase